MEFIKKMKKREFVEMGLKTLISFFVLFIAIILMEGMIYGIQLHALKTKGSGSVSNSDSTIAYCIKESEDKYFVVYYNKDLESKWSATKNYYISYEQTEHLTAKKVVYGAPNAFIFSITPVHYVIMAVFVAGIGGFFAYKFVKLGKTYKEIEKTFKETGTIEL